MCSGSVSKRKPSTMEGESEGEGEGYGFSVFLELAASDDLAAFKAAVEDRGHGIDEASLWYGRRLGSRKMGFEERTPLMIAAMFGSSAVVAYILGTGLTDVNRVCGSDRASALHCAAAGASDGAVEVVKLLLAASADLNLLDAGGNRPADLIATVQSTPRKKKALEVTLNGSSSGEEERCQLPELVIEESGIWASPPPAERREYPVDLSLPDIKNGIYSTDDFRMYTFKIKPCSRAYSHDWTECPFVHPGENARRRDPRKFHYSCVPCPEFRKGACRQGDGCEYAHGIFECWLHPAQYRTRLCKDETGCQRRVCFFAHKPDELRPLYASTGSAVPSPRSFQSPGLDITPPMTPTGVSSPMSANMWPNPPTLQLPGSRLKAALSARDMEFDAESYRLRHDISSGMSSPSGWSKGLSTNLDDMFSSHNMQGLSLDSPTGMQMRQNMSPNYHGLPSSPVRAAPLFVGAEGSRSAAFAKRSQSFIERSAVNRRTGFPSPASPGVSSNFPDWGSPDGKLDWGMQGEELTKMRKSASFGFRTGGSSSYPAPPAAEPDVSWVQSLVIDPQPAGSFEEQQQCHFDAGAAAETLPAWLEQMYMEQEQMVA